MVHHAGWKLRLETLMFHERRFSKSIFHYNLLSNSAFSSINSYWDFLSFINHRSSFNNGLKRSFFTVVADVNEGISAFCVLQNFGGAVVAGTFGTNSCKIFNASGFCAQYNVHNGPVWDVLEVEPAGVLATASFDGSVALTDCGNGRCTLSSRLLGHEDRVLAAAWNRDLHVLASVSRDRSCRIWDLRNTHRATAVTLQSSCLYSAASSGNVLAVGCHGGEVQVMDMRKLPSGSSPVRTSTNTSSHITARFRCSVLPSPVFAMQLVTLDSASSTDALCVTGSKSGDLCVSRISGSSISVVSHFSIIINYFITLIRGTYAV